MIVIADTLNAGRYSDEVLRLVPDVVKQRQLILLHDNARLQVSSLSNFLKSLDWTPYSTALSLTEHL